jgi:glycosyltransferase involved in cell wall biosynthesis
MNDPLVSVVITAYNLGWCIENTIQSVLDQTYSNLEIIVVDDASTDDTEQRIARFADRIKYIRHETNQGVLNDAEAGPARNSGVAAASGDYIAILDGDDLWEPGKIAVQVEAARRFPDAGMIVVDGVSFAHEDGRVLRTTLLLDSPDPFFSTLPAGAVVSVDLYSRFLEDCLFDTPSQVMIASRVFDAVGLFSECRCDDYEFYIRASEKFNVAVVKQPLVRYRQHTANLSGAAPDQFFRFVQPNIDIWKQHLRSCRNGANQIVQERIGRALKTAADRALQAGRRSKRAWARRYLWGLITRNTPHPAVAHVGVRLFLLHCPQRVISSLQVLGNRARRDAPL